MKEIKVSQEEMNRIFESDEWIVLFLLMDFNGGFEKSIKELEEKNKEIKEKKRSEEIGRMLERNPYF